VSTQAAAKLQGQGTCPVTKDRPILMDLFS